jgi:hypothetical protein
MMHSSFPALQVLRVLVLLGLALAFLVPLL